MIRKAAYYNFVTALSGVSCNVGTNTVAELGSVRSPRKPVRFASIGVEHHKPCLYPFLDGSV
nr:MAG TPA: hypothetical protein [Caudoviricetes sp.]